MKVIAITVKKRSKPSFFTASTVSAPAGYEFLPGATSIVKETINGAAFTTTWFQLPDMLWVPEYSVSGGPYVVDVSAPLPPPPTAAVVILYADVTYTEGGAEKTKRLVPA